MTSNNTRAEPTYVSTECLNRTLVKTLIPKSFNSSVKKCASNVISKPGSGAKSKTRSEDRPPGTTTRTDRQGQRRGPTARDNDEDRPPRTTTRTDRQGQRRVPTDREGQRRGPTARNNDEYGQSSCASRTSASLTRSIQGKRSIPRPLERVFINEDLTSTRASLAADARKLRKEEKISDTWTVNGKIMVKNRQNEIAPIKDVL